MADAVCISGVRLVINILSVSELNLDSSRAFARTQAPYGQRTSRVLASDARSTGIAEAECRRYRFKRHADCVKTRLRAASGQHWCAAAVRLQHGIERRMMRCRHAESASLPHHMAREAFYFERTSSGEIVVHRGVHVRREAL